MYIEMIASFFLYAIIIILSIYILMYKSFVSIMHKTVSSRTLEEI